MDHHSLFTSLHFHIHFPQRLTLGSRTLVPRCRRRVHHNFSSVDKSIIDIIPHNRYHTSSQCCFFVKKMVIAFLKHVISFFFATDSGSNIRAKQAVRLATQKVRDLLIDDGYSLTDIFKDIERAGNESNLKLGFNRLNEILWALSTVAPLTEHKGVIFAALKELGYSHKFGSYLNSALTPFQAINDYKTSIVKELVEHIRKRENFKRINKSFEDDLFLTYFTQNYWQQLDSDTRQTLQGQLSILSESVLSPCRKRGFSKISQAGAVEHTKKKRDSFSDKTDSAGKGIRPGRKKRRS